MGKIANILLVLSNLLGTIFCGISAYFGAAIYYGWKPAGNAPPFLGKGAAVIGTGAPSMNPYWPLIIFGALGIALLVNTWIFRHKIMNKGTSSPIGTLTDSAELGKATTVLPMSSPVLLPAPMLVKPKKFYSERNKSDLANALTDLSEILIKNGPNIRQQAQQIVEIWQGKSRVWRLPDLADLIEKLNNLGNLANTLYQTLYDDNSFSIKYIVYSDELGPILQNSKLGNSPNGSIPNFQGRINGFRNVLMTIQRAEKYNDRDLIKLMVADSRPAFDNYLSGIRIFNEWVDETQKRIAAFRNSQL